jgi:hypothetical protein
MLTSFTRLSEIPQDRYLYTRYNHYRWNSWKTLRTPWSCKSGERAYLAEKAVSEDVAV